ncbi:MAG: hypothetical protein FD161_69 [Limisphaerales bacterium]|nr:MAG: hypothetical protein FD161_69 [Limisphaerales bacterium]KAG0510515.1 MAG: hypothetical protein E1N63_69 [Limisphaerales bacterium]TXT52788.1 MAG: hypothetical protein FD140_331 [Limisphaerales bacterium]
MIFQKRTDFLPSSSGNALGSSVRFELTREFHIDSIYIRLTLTPTAVMATACADGIYNLLKRVTLKVSDGARTRSVVDATGRGLVEYARQILGGLNGGYDYNVGANGTSALTLVIPIFFAHPQIADPIGSAFLLPAPRYNNNPELTLQFGSQADMDVNGTPTFAVAAGITAQVIVHRREVNDPNFTTYDTELSEISYPFTSSGTNQLTELQVPGSYTGMLLRCFTSTSALGDISTSGGEFKLQALGNVLRRFQLAHVVEENDFSKFRPFTASAASAGSVTYQTAGLYYQDFLTDRVGESVAELGSVLDTNYLMATGARLQLIGDIDGAANKKINILSHRIFGVLDRLKMRPKLAA